MRLKAAVGIVAFMFISYAQGRYLRASSVVPPVQLPVVLLDWVAFKFKMSLFLSE